MSNGNNIESVTQESKIFTLPNEILIKIMSYIPTRHLLVNVARVSRMFYMLSREPMVHSHVTFMDNVDERSANKFLCHNLCIKEVNLLAFHQFKLFSIKNESFVQSLSQQKMLRVLNIEFYCLLNNETQLISLLKHPNAKFLKKIKLAYLGHLPREKPYCGKDWNSFAN